MGKLDLTKQLFATTLKKLSTKKSLEDISVTEIVETAGSNRQTFYYHFKDKQDLICYIFDQDMKGIIDDRNESVSMDHLLNYMKDYEYFYSSALNSNDQNNLQDYIYETLSRRVNENLELELDFQKKQLSDANKKMIVAYFSNALLGILLNWVNGGMDLKISDFHLGEENLTQDFLKFYVETYAE